MLKYYTVHRYIVIRKMYVNTMDIFEKVPTPEITEIVKTEHFNN